MHNRKLIDYLPDFLKDVKENDAILTMAEQPEIDSLWEASDNALNDQFIEDATMNGVQRWEKILNIVPKSTDSIDIRKFSILTRINEQLPFTITSLKEQLKSLCGEDGYDIFLDEKNYTLSVRVALAAQSNFKDVELLLRRIVPAKLVIELSMKYHTHFQLMVETHGRLQNFTHEDIRNGVI